MAEIANSSKKRLINFDIAKAICIILVVIGHYIPDNSPGWYIMNRTFIYSFHMPLFMFASGYIYIAFKKEESYGRFIMKKVRRLMIPYLVTSVLIVTIKLLTERNAYVENPVTMLSYVKILYNPEAGYFLWFIWALWWMFVLLPLLTTRQSRLLGFAVALVLHYLPITLTHVFCLEQMRQMLVFFMLGVVIFDYKDYFIKYTKQLALPIIILFAGFEYVYLNPNLGGGISWLSNLTPYLGIAVVMYFSTLLANKRSVLSSKIFCYIAPSTYIIYLLHTTFEGFTKAVIHKIPLLENYSNDMYFVLGALLVIVVGIAGPVLTHRYILAKFKITRKMFGLE